MYEAPSQEIFDEMKKISIEIWNTYDNTYWYVDEKVNRIKYLENWKDNFMTMFQMFDTVNQTRLIQKASEELKIELAKRYYE